MSDDFINKLAVAAIDGPSEVLFDDVDIYFSTFSSVGQLDAFAKIYFKLEALGPTYYCSSNMLAVTFHILKYYPRSFNNMVLMELLNKHSLKFTLEQLMLIRNRLTKVGTCNNSQNSPLLLNYILSDFGKFTFYLQAGYSIYIPYDNVVLTKEHDDFGDISIHFTTYYADKNLIGLSLEAVVRIQHPGLLSTAS